MLRVSLLGNLGADPEQRWTNKGTSVTTFRVAVNQVRTGPDGERQENTEWFRVRMMGQRGEYLMRLSKGAKVFVVGRLDIGRYKSKDGDMRTSFDVWADEVQALSPRLGAPAEGSVPLEPEAEPEPAGISSLAGGASNGSSGRSKRSEAATKEATPEELEDLPF